jgi:hypothetical protein
MVPLASQPMLGGERWFAAGSLRDRAGTEGEVIGARPYRQGDSLRRVHWPQTARRDVLIVCELQATARRRVIVALDEAAFPADTPDDAALLDWALRVVGSLCRQLHSHACDVVCRLGTEKLLPSAGPDGLRPVLDRLAQYQPDAGRAVAGRTVSGRDGGKNDDGLLIVVTSGFAPGATRADSPRDRQRRMVVLDREHESPTPEATGHARGRPWLWLHADGDIARQLQRQWEKRCHEDWSHN